MDTVKIGIAGVQLTLVGLFVVTFFGDAHPYPLVGLLLGIVGTVVASSAMFER